SATRSTTSRHKRTEIRPMASSPTRDRGKERRMSQPVSLDLERPVAFERGHVFLRLALLIVIGWIAHPIGLLWLGLPVVAAILVAQNGGQRYLHEDAAMGSRVLAWLVALISYLALLTDRLPGGGEQPVRFQVDSSDAPTVSSVLLRILFAIP